jgi:integrase
LELLSRIFSLAVRLGLAEFNPCTRVSKFKLQNQRYRYLLPDEEPALLAQCTKGRKHQVDFFRNLIVFDKTKSGKTRVVEVNSEVRQTLLELCKGKQPDDYVWINPAMGQRYTNIKRAFSGACEDAKIYGLVWHDLRATYGTRLGEAGFNAYAIAELMGHANITTSRRYVRSVPSGSGEAVLLKNQRRHNTVTSDAPAGLALVGNR